MANKETNNLQNNNMDADLPTSPEEMEEMVKQGKLHKPSKNVATKKVVYNPEWLIESFTTKFSLKLFGMRKISIGKSEIEKYCEELKDYLVYFNSGDEFTYFMLGVPVDSIPVPNKFKDLIYPQSVRLNPSDRQTKNLVMYTKHDGNGLSLLGWINLLDNIARVTKQSGSDDCTTLGALRAPKSYAEVVDKVMRDGKVKYDNNPYMPIALDKVATSLMEGSYFDSKAEVVIEHYVAQFK